jgi:hypothetical protein
VCPTEIIAFSDRAKEFEALNCQLLAASTDTPEVHLAWIKTPRKRGGLGFMQVGAAPGRQGGTQLCILLVHERAEPAAAATCSVPAVWLVGAGAAV